MSITVPDTLGEKHRVIPQIASVAPPAVPARPPRRAGRLPRVVVRLLRIPLALKIVGANAVIAAATVAAVMATHGVTLSDPRTLALLVGALVVAQAANAALVVVALRPLRALEVVGSRVLSGDTTARVPDSPLADREIAQMGRSINNLLDTLMRERDRIRRLAAQVIRAQDEERARIAHELHDSTAQTMAAITLQLGALERACADEEIATKLDEVRETAADAIENVRLLSHTIYPRVLDDLGLRAALDWLARRTRETTDVEVDVVVRGYGDVRPAGAAALYRVAQEALLNAVRHGAPKAIEVRLSLDAESATLEVEDNGVGFDVRSAETRRPGMGIFAMRERVALVDGVLDVDSARGRGCCVRARIPLG